MCRSAIWLHTPQGSAREGAEVRIETDRCDAAIPVRHSAEAEFSWRNRLERTSSRTAPQVVRRPTGCHNERPDEAAGPPERSHYSPRAWRADARADS